MKSLSFVLICTLLNCLVLTAAEPSRPGPRKPFVSKSGGAAPRPFTPSSPVTPNVTSNSVQPEVKSGQAEIIAITRSHKVPTVHPVVIDQNEVVIPNPSSESTATATGTGTNAQVGRIIDRK